MPSEYMSFQIAFRCELSFASSATIWLETSMSHKMTSQRGCPGECFITLKMVGQFTETADFPKNAIRRKIQFCEIVNSSKQLISRKSLLPESPILQKIQFYEKLNCKKNSIPRKSRFSEKANFLKKPISKNLISRSN